jgi:4-hydroxybenzoate polyprenyltransferase
MKLSDLAKRMIITILVISLICVIGSVIYYRSLKFVPFLLGVLLGSAVSVIKVFLLERAIDKALKMESMLAKNYVSLQHVLRLLLTGVALFLGAVVDQSNLWGVVCGVFAFQIATYNLKFTSKN